MQQLLDKIASMKAKLDDVEKRTTVFEKDTDSKLNNIKNAISIVENIAGNLDKMSTEVESKMKSIDDKAKANELRLERKLEQFEINTEKFEKMIKETESKNTKDEMRRDRSAENVSEVIVKEAEENKNKIKQLALELKEKQEKIEKWLDKSEKQTLATFDEKTKQLTVLAGAIEEIKRNVDIKHKELSKTLLVTATDEELASVKSELERLKEHTSTLISKSEFHEVKKAAVDIDKIISESLSDIREEFNDVKHKMSHLADIEKINKSFAELKMDVASTESGLQRRIEDMNQKIEMMRDGDGSSEQVRTLTEQNNALRSKIESVERRLKEGLSSTLDGFEGLGEAFANKHEVSLNLNELSSEIKQMQQTIYGMEQKHNELSKQMSVREELQPEPAPAQENMEATINQIYGYMNEFSAQKSMVQEMQEEFQILKEQIIITQNAIVELNSAMHRMIAPQPAQNQQMVSMQPQQMMPIPPPPRPEQFYPQ